MNVLSYAVSKSGRFFMSNGYKDSMPLLYFLTTKKLLR